MQLACVVVVDAEEDLHQAPGTSEEVLVRIQHYQAARFTGDDGVFDESIVDSAFDLRPRGLGDLLG